jgi:ferredoxin-nitrite reductase
VHFRVAVGGITGHGDFAADLGVAIAPEQCVAVAVAIVRVFIDEGDRTDRKRARLKYVLERMGLERFLAEVEKRLTAPLPRVPLADCEPRTAPKRGAHVGFHPQKQPGMLYCGVALPAGKMTAAQMRWLACIATEMGSGSIRLTPWQNLLIADIPEARRDEVAESLAAIGLTAEVSQVRAGIVACTGNAGCKFALSDTKRHALAIADQVDARIAIDTPVNVHLTGCPNSCAQHYIGDIGLLGTKVPVGEEQEVEGYHVYVGGGFAERRELARELMRGVPADEVPRAIEGLLRAYMAHRSGPDETFQAFTQRHPVETLRAFAAGPLKRVA